MEIHQLRYVVAVAEASSFTKAAAALHVAQPGVSAQIRLLERELGQDLFDRSGRQVRLTDAGEAVMPYARSALAAIDGVREAAEEIGGLLRGHIAFGTVTSHGADLSSLLSAFHRDHPAITITLTEAGREELVAALLEGRLDGAIVALGARPLEGLGLQVIDDQPLVAAVAAHDPLAQRRSITLERLCERTLICLPTGSGVRSILETASRAAGLTPNVAFEASSPRALVSLVGQGLGVAVVPAPYVRNRDGVVALEIRPALRGRLALAWRLQGPVGPAARVFLERARAVL
ncbi:LysR family transcriptional regulator [Mycobacteroides immunogenum]|uniref:Probable hydrogen peroxide-inducible genes activator n=1 Tax=Mycobacteroides immunogenum TaxID=83262 RepID=A0A7V8RUK2_9MYCO|nr:LysR family transcriptional regulator [Mycobacteroides immunogenum]AMT70893.1 LysR family transcriptional regulator [Mycobacteroides immunogenum]ANO04000.1 LysR family transcriptional regulator [Mycobacteroides immunogenum]KIU39480.1 LysR family transcriptional regulator [Mycobacteroides immunogenum]KPG03985.1 LysR family transcriptional regulator [Mycobacteroides immunogenum]KPG04435.1 LysR family transcriptional regulator [Mycobacteroides immunogenum]